MNPFDMQMMAVTSLIVVFTSIMSVIDKKIGLSMAGLLVMIAMVWGDDVCSRNDRLHFYAQHFDGEGEIICQDDNANPILISKTHGWERKGCYLFKGNRGIELLNDPCEIIDQKEPRCIRETWMIGTGITTASWVFGGMAWIFRRHEREYNEEKNERRKRAPTIQKEET